MRNRNYRSAITLAVVFQAAWCSTSRAQATSAPSSGTVVLDARSAWRVFHVLKSSVVQSGWRERSEEFSMDFFGKFTRKK